MTDIQKEIAKIIQSEEFINYCDNQLFAFAVEFVEQIFKNFSEKGKIEKGEVVVPERLSLTQVRGIRNIALQEINKPGELAKMAENRKGKDVNKKSKDIWENLEKLFDYSPDSLEKVIEIKNLSPKKYLENKLPPGLTNNEEREFRKNFYAYLLKSFCIHFDAHYRYLDNIRGGKTKK